VFLPCWISYLKRKTDRPLSKTDLHTNFDSERAMAHPIKPKTSLVVGQTRPRSRFLDDLACFERAPATTVGLNRVSFVPGP
jgi:hypothetical protein